MSDFPLTKPSAVTENIRAIKTDWQLNMTEVAEILGVQRVTIYHWLSGKSAPDAENIRRMLVIAAGGRIWVEHTNGKNWDYLLDYTGPQTNAITLRERMKSPCISVEELKELIPEHISQYQKAREEVRKIIGEPRPFIGKPLPRSTLRLNRLWAENAKKLHKWRTSNK